jgi:hypothetical protein
MTTAIASPLPPKVGDEGGASPPAVRSRQPLQSPAPDEAVPTGTALPAAHPNTGSLQKRMIFTAAAWISVLLLGGGLLLDRTLTGLVTRNFDEQLGYMLTAMVASAEIGPDGEVFFNRPLGDQRFLEPNSGLYWQISGQGHDDFPYDSDQFKGEKLRIIERSIILPGSPTKWWFTVAAAREEMDTQINRIRSIVVWSFVVLGLGLMGMATLQTWYGLGPLRRVRRAIADMRSGGANRVTEPLPWKFSRWSRN